LLFAGATAVDMLVLLMLLHQWPLPFVLLLLSI